jgi:hypothetical protein
VSIHTSNTLKRCERINSYGCTCAAKRSANPIGTIGIAKASWAFY